MGNLNTANGSQALYSNTTGHQNTANGYQALFSNTTGYYNTANGYQALLSNTEGTYNTANGYQALYSNTTGFDNTANGFQALYSNTIGSVNTANGWQALLHNTTGGGNTANGFEALKNNSTGSSNIALGTDAGFSLTTGDFNIDIGNLGVAGEASTIRIGDSNQSATFIAGIYGATASGGAAVYVNSGGQLGTLTSSARFKQNIKPMDKASEALFALKPVNFRYKQDFDPDRAQRFGLIAEDVEKVNPDLVTRDGEGKVNTVRYEAVNAMLLNEFLKEHRKVEQQEATIAQLKKGMEVLTAQFQEQASQIQKVSAQLALSKSAPRVAGND